MNWELLIRVIRQEATSTELHTFREWLRVSPENKTIYEAIAARHRTIEQVVTPDTVKEEWARLMTHLPDRTPAVKVRKLAWMRYAAAAVITAMIGISSWWLLAPHQRAAVPSQLVMISTAASEKKKVYLPDSSVVWLHYNATLRYNSHTFNHTSRQLQLTGEAFFDVMPAAGKPFTVQTSHLQVTVLGTSFHIAAAGDKITEVTVATGKINVKGLHVQKDVLPLQRLTYDPVKQVASIATTTLETATALKNNQLIFYRDNMKTMAAKIERWYNRKVVLCGVFHHQVAFTGTIRDNGIREVLSGLGYQAGFTYRLNNDSIFIYPH